MSGHAGTEPADRFTHPQALIDALQTELEAARKREHELKDWLAEHTLDHEDEPADHTTLQLAESLFAWGDRAWGIAGSLQDRLEAAEKALREDAAGRPLSELLTVAADLLDGYGGGPVADCLRLKAEEVDALAGSAARTEERAGGVPFTTTLGGAGDDLGASAGRLRAV